MGAPFNVCPYLLFKGAKFNILIENKKDNICLLQVAQRLLYS